MSSCTEFVEILLCLFFFLQTGTSVVSDGNMPNFDVPMWNVTAVTGATAVLPCTVSGITDDNFKVAWSARKKLLTVSDKRIITDTRMSVERPFTKSWNLHIRSVRLNDSGQYLCQINTSPPKHMKVLLTVHEPPVITDNAGDQTVKEGSTVELWCKVKGTPYPSVTWYRHYIYDQQSRREVIGEEGEALKIHNISRHCEDVYECVANNGVDPVARQSMNVTVQFAPEVELYSHKMGQIQGKETMLACRITANPFGYIVWKRRGKEINNSHKYGISVFNDGRHTKTMNLRIGHINEDDYGRYSCYAQNNNGEDAEEMTLYELRERKVSTTQSSDPFLIDTKTLKYPSRTDVYYNAGGHVGKYPTQSWNTPVYVQGNARASRGGSDRLYRTHVTFIVLGCCFIVQCFVKVSQS